MKLRGLVLRLIYSDLPYDKDYNESTIFNKDTKKWMFEINCDVAVILVGELYCGFDFCEWTV